MLSIDRMITWLKIIHVATLAIWMAGLVSLPGLYVQRAHVTDSDQLFRLQRMVRFAFLTLISPAAFAAVASGTALIFLREAFEPWLSAKLALVAMLALVHTFSGLVIIRLFDEGERYPAWRFVATTCVALLIVLAILYLVLAKPVIDPTALMPEAMAEPGGLRRLVEPFNPWQKP